MTGEISTAFERVAALAPATLGDRGEPGAAGWLACSKASQPNSQQGSYDTLAHLLTSLSVLTQSPRRTACNLTDESTANPHCRLSPIEILKIDSPFVTSVRMVMPFVVVFNLAGVLLAIDRDDQLGYRTLGIEILGQMFVLETKPR